jgi:hypothetical protein
VIAISIVKGAMEAFAEYLAALIPLLPWRSNALLQIYNTLQKTISANIPS